MKSTPKSRRTRAAGHYAITTLVLLALSGSLAWLGPQSQADIAAADKSGQERDAQQAQTQPATEPAAPRAPATQPAQGWPPKPGSCITSECHADLAQLAHRHDPVRREACQECHGPEQPDHKFPLQREGTELCTSCHAAAGKKHVHAVISDDGCLPCHSPHGSEAEYLLTGESVAATCGECHDIDRKEHLHGPFGDGECTGCHHPHESDYGSLLLYGEGKDHCFECHEDVKDQLADAERVHDPVNEGCEACHEVHSSDHPYLLNAPADEVCLGCHEEQSALAGGPHDRSRNPQAWPSAPQEGKCLACHVPHAGDQAGLFRIAPAKGKSLPDAACLACHPGAAPGSGSASALTHPTRAKGLPEKHGLPVVKAAAGRREIGCRTCHVPHGGAQPAYLTRVAPDEISEGLCLRCHPGKQRITLSKHSPQMLKGSGFAGDLCKPCHAVHGKPKLSWR
jgi:predicted CXXCH cytochrome family protein